MRFVIYKNSILATICSMFGAACIAMAVMSMIDGELGILPSIGVIAVGVGLMWLAGVISDRKAKRKQAKAAAKAAASGAGHAPTARAASHTSQAANTAPVMKGKPVKKCAVFAGIFFLLAALMSVWAAYLYNSRTLYLAMEDVVWLIGMGVLMVAAFRTRHIQEVSVLFVLGFLVLTLSSAADALNSYYIYGFGGYSTNTGIHHIMILSPLLESAAHCLMALFALFSTRRIKKHLGGIVRCLWLLPISALLLAFAKDISDSYFWDLFQVTRINGFRYPPHPLFLETFSQLCAILAVLLSGFCCQRICRNRIEAQAQPAPQPAAPAYAPPVQERPVQPQPEPRYQAPEPPVQPQPVAAQVNPEDVQKKILAYKDLLDCGILSQEEYDQKIRELTRG